jgi:formate C-acetyltransferase
VNRPEPPPTASSEEKAEVQTREKLGDRSAGVVDKPLLREPWQGFAGGDWQARIDVRDFIQRNVTSHAGGPAFLKGPTSRTLRLWGRVEDLLERERTSGVLDVSQVPSSITAHGPGYVDRALELIVGLQTDAPLTRAIFPNGGLRAVEAALRAYGFALDPEVVRVYTRYRKTHNDGVLDAYPDDVVRAGLSHLISGLPDTHGRGRIIGDYRRVPLYGVRALVREKEADRASLGFEESTEEIIRDREELSEQLRALGELVRMAKKYGFDIDEPARTAREAVQWLYFAYLGAIKEQNGAAMSFGRTSTFLDIYFERDLALGYLSEREAQELVDDLVIKLRLVRFLRTPEYEQLFAGDLTWVTEAIGGLSDDGRPLVTKTSFRFLNTLYNLGPAPEPNLTVLWSQALPDGFKRYCAQVSLDTGSIQYASDDLLRAYFDDDAAIACSVSAVRVGRQMQFFGARVNLAKCLLYAINGGRDELTGEQIMPAFAPVTGDTLVLGEVLARFDGAMDWLARTYVNAMNCVHYMHDKYAYERLEMALHDYALDRNMAFGIAGLSVVADSLSAIAHARVEVHRDASGLVTDYVVHGKFPQFGNNDDRADRFARDVARDFIHKLRRYKTYRNAEHTQSILTITSNVVYGKHTGNTPDGRRLGTPFASGANPVDGRDRLGVIASASSVAKIQYADCQDGISLTETIVPTGLGVEATARVTSLVDMLDGLFERGLFHVNVHVLTEDQARIAAGRRAP